MRRFFLDTLNENNVIMFNLPRHGGKTYYSMYAMLSYLSEIKHNPRINPVSAAFISLNERQSLYNRGMLRDVAKIFTDLKQFKQAKDGNIDLQFKDKCKIYFYNQNNFRLAGVYYDVVVLDEFYDFKEENQDSILNINITRNSKLILNGDKSERKFPIPIKTFYNMYEFDKRLSLNRKLKKVKRTEI